MEDPVSPSAPQTSSNSERFDALKAASTTLDHPCWRERLQIVRALGAEGVSACSFAPRLADLALNDNDPEVRAAAVEALGCMGEGAAPAMAEVLGSDRPELRQSAISALAALGEVAVPQLMVALGSEHCDVRLASAEAVGRVRQAAATLSQDACKVLLPELGASDAQVRVAACAALVDLGGSAASCIPAAAALLEDASPLVQCTAAALLGALADEGAADHVDAVCAVVLPKVRDTDPEVRSAAAAAVGHIGQACPADVEAACRALEEDQNNRDPAVRKFALGGLAVFGRRFAGPDVREESVNAAWAGLDDDDPFVQSAAAAALCSLGDAAAQHLPEALRTVSAHLRNSPVPAVRMAAAEALGRIPEDIAGQMIPEAYSVAAKELDSEDWAVRLAAARAIGSLWPVETPHTRSARQRASDALKSSEVLCRITAAKTVGYLEIAFLRRAEQACRVAAAELQNKDPLLRLAAAHALGALGIAAEAHTEELALLLSDSRAAVRDAAATTLGGLGHFGRGHLAVASRNVDWKRRAAAVRVLDLDS